ncbi:hypothetical protein AKACHI_08740 [Aquiluna sp. KACHI24]|nr:hypothetical protein AKACHI_08740 [Aquiluna sp. KACHI24]
MSVATVVCSRNRPDRLTQLLGLLSNQTLPPDFIIVVDSSDDNLGLVLADRNLHFIHSLPGLPFQRQIGLERAAALGANTVVFLDDDVSIPPDFLERIMVPVLANPRDLIGTNDSEMDAGWKFLPLLRRANWISKGALAHLGRTPPRLEEVGWVPGFCMAGHVEVFLSVGFPTEIRMLTEDIAFQMCFKSHGRILLQPNLGLQHFPDSRGRLGAIHSTLKWNYMRRRLVAKYPEVFSMRHLYLEVMLLFVVDIIRIRPSAIGHLRFLLRSICRCEPVYDFRT